jgi:thioredoxin reductase (NADPH)
MPTGALARRFDQMFPVLPAAEIERVRRFGELRRFQPGELLCRVGKPSPGMYVILSGRLSVVSRDPLGRSLPIAEFAQHIGGTPEEMEILPGEFVADLGTLTDKPSALDVQALEEVAAILVPPDQLRALLIEEAELGERILRALLLRHVAMIEMGFGGPVLIGALRSPEVTKLSAFLGRNGTPFRVVRSRGGCGRIVAGRSVRLGRPPARRHAGRNGAQETDEAGAGTGARAGGDDPAQRPL